MVRVWSMSIAQGRGLRPSRAIATLCALSMLAACSGRGINAGSGNPAAPGQGQQVHLIWNQNAWKVKLNNGPEQDPATARTTLARNTAGPTMFTVDIQGNTTASFTDPGGLDVWEGDNAKMQPKTGINSTQVLGPIVTKNRKQLIFFDLNQGDPVTLNYRLNFDHGPSVDPIIGNGGHN